MRCRTAWILYSINTGVNDKQKVSRYQNSLKFKIDIRYLDCKKSHKPVSATTHPTQVEKYLSKIEMPSHSIHSMRRCDIHAKTEWHPEGQDSFATVLHANPEGQDTFETVPLLIPVYHRALTQLQHHTALSAAAERELLAIEVCEQEL
jgi:hypothetical protein